MGQGFLTLSLAARTTRRRTTEQVWLPYHPLHITNPSHIIRKQAPHAPRTALMPSAPTHARSSCAPRAVSRLILWLRVDEQHGPRTSSIFLGPGAKSWAVVAGRPDVFFRESGRCYGFRFAIFCIRAREGALGGRARTWTGTVVGSVYIFYSARVH